jgi:hypothetical protein
MVSCYVDLSPLSWTLFLAIVRTSQQALSNRLGTVSLFWHDRVYLPLQRIQGYTLLALRGFVEISQGLSCNFLQ